MPETSGGEDNPQCEALFSLSIICLLLVNKNKVDCILAIFSVTIPAGKALF